jgi:hypothetical protein
LPEVLTYRYDRDALCIDQSEVPDDRPGGHIIDGTAPGRHRRHHRRGARGDVDPRPGPADPSALAPAYGSGDGLHPNDAGCQAIADAVDLRALLAG